MFPCLSSAAPAGAVGPGRAGWDCSFDSLLQLALLTSRLLFTLTLCLRLLPRTFSRAHLPFPLPPFCMYLPQSILSARSCRPHPVHFLELLLAFPDVPIGPGEV